MVLTTMRRPAAALAALGAAAALACGCGSSSPQAGSAARPTLTKAQVIHRGGAICRAAERRVERLPQITTQHPFAPGTPATERVRARRFLAGYADALDASRTGLARLAAPPQDRRLLHGYLADIGVVVARLRDASRAPAPRVEGEAQSAFALFERASRQTAAYGFPRGVCGAGSSG